RLEPYREARHSALIEYSGTLGAHRRVPGLIPQNVMMVTRDRRSETQFTVQVLRSCQPLCLRGPEATTQTFFAPLNAAAKLTGRVTASSVPLVSTFTPPASILHLLLTAVSAEPMRPEGNQLLLEPNIG